VNAVLQVLQGAGLVLVTWTGLAIVIALLLVPWLGAQARANARLSQDLRRAGWRHASSAAGDHRVVSR
jgi:hypothetical protein